MASKQEFLNTISADVIANDNFYKKVYGYSVTDKEFLLKIANKLLEIGRKDIIQAYNQWLKDWKAKDDEMMKSVSQWYAKQLNNNFERKVKNHDVHIDKREEGADECQETEMQYLQRQKSSLKKQEIKLQKQEKQLMLLIEKLKSQAQA